MNLRPLVSLLLLSAVLCVGGGAWTSALPARPTPLAQAQGLIDYHLNRARAELERGRLPEALDSIYQALERDHNSRKGWQLLADYGRKVGDADLELWALYRDFRLAESRGLTREQREALLAPIRAVDPTDAGLFDLTRRFADDLIRLAKRYEKEARPHGAIRVYRRLQALDPENTVAAEAIERIASAPDPSLAPHATPRDLFEGIDQEFIDAFNTEHATWENAAKEVREHYITITNSGYENLMRTAEAMEQVNAFYREFFRYGGAGDERTVPRITVHLFNTRDEYLKLGMNPVEWSAGHFTGSHVETYLPETGFEGVVGTLFHEAAHQFVSLATSATGWLNEGLASFFEGTRIQANGTVIMNLPAGHRLFPLAQRMEAGWMTSAIDGVDPENARQSPDKAPTFRILVENEYAWGPPWYAPTWGLVYFLYNFQDPWDGRFVYRAGFQEFINSSGGRVGKGAVQNFEKVVLAQASKPITKERPQDQPPLKLPKNVEELDELWKEWILRLRDRQAGKAEEALPYLRWARFAQEAGMGSEAKEHYERALLEDGYDPEALEGLADVLLEFFDEEDRATVLLEQLLRVLEADPETDPLRIAKLERRIQKLDPDRRNLTQIEVRLLQEAETALLAYRDGERPRMVMEWSRRLARDFGEPGFFDLYGEMVRSFGGSIDLWDRAYNEADLDGWLVSGDTFQADGTQIVARFGKPEQNNYDYRFLTLDRLTSGDFSLEADVEVRRGQGTFAGIVFGQKGTSDFHGAALFPGEAKEGTVDTGYADLFSSFGGTIKAWRHVPVALEPKDEGGSIASVWHTLRLDVTGAEVDVWVDGERLMTHRFSGREVLLGSFGLLTGPGKARFRNVRYLSRDPRDPAGAVERAARLAAAGVGSGQPVGGSYQNLPAPFPEVAQWVQGQRDAWAEAGPVPQLLVLFSQAQNDAMPLHGWLQALAERGEPYGLRIVSIAQRFDKNTLGDYLKTHAFPDVVGVDAPGATATALGATFDTYFIERFNLPRLILIDPTGTVVWEGDPGFKVGQTPEEPYATYLDAPLEALVQDFQLLERRAWQNAWRSEAEPALERGDWQAALEAVRTGQAFDPIFSAEEQRAHLIYQRLETLTGDPDSLIAWLSTENGHAGADTAEAWIEALGASLNREQTKQLNRLRSHRSAKRWKGLVQNAHSIQQKGQWLDKFDAWAKRVEALELPFARAPLARMRAALDAQDEAALQAEGARVETWTAAWMTRTLLLP